MAEPQDSVWLNGVEIPIVGSVLWDVVPPCPNQIVTQEPGEADFQPVSKHTWRGLQGGAGIEKWSPEHNDRYWEAVDVDTSQTTQTLGPLVTTLGSFGKLPVKILKGPDGKIWAIGDLQISIWNGSSWDSKKTDFSNPTDAILFFGTV